MPHDEASPATMPTRILTVGYGARDPQALIELLLRHDVRYLIDVRSKPYSRFKPEFNTDVLAKFLKRQKVGYVFMGENLGGQPDDPACYREGKVAYDLCRQHPAFLYGIDRLRKAQAQGIPVALMCAEGKPEQCHRSKLIAQHLDDEGIPVAHIDEAGDLRTHREIMRLIDGGQIALFDEFSPEQHSRRRYRDSEDD